MSQNPMPQNQSQATARRALDEAEKRRHLRKKAELPKEYGGPKGCEPTRYGDWERKGIASDF